MDIVSETVEMGVREQRFDLKCDDAVVPGIRWSPEGAEDVRTTILIGHGGTQHKRVPNVLALARRFVRHLGYAAVALDAPGHGERITDPEGAERRRRILVERIAAGPGAPERTYSPEDIAEWKNRTAQGSKEWRALVDELSASDQGHTFGYWGVSMGTMIGLPYVSSDPRISAAVLGLAGLGGTPGATALETAARELRAPVLFVFQWDDELMSREAGLRLFDAFGSTEKSMHIHPGGHIETPLWERQAYEAFFARHLGRPESPDRS